EVLSRYHVSLVDAVLDEFNAHRNAGERSLVAGAVELLANYELSKGAVLRKLKAAWMKEVEGKSEKAVQQREQLFNEELVSAECNIDGFGGLGYMVSDPVTYEMFLTRAGARALCEAAGLLERVTV
ncbi:MAG: hypothetical protein KDK78_12115, partial [Chlamydiia bacterium]|nr:hypothetical protein [Chlamydiia bacterium]